jgi:hypothetical protein
MTDRDLGSDFANDIEYDQVPSSPTRTQSIHSSDPGPSDGGAPASTTPAEARSTSGTSSGKIPSLVPERAESFFDDDPGETVSASDVQPQETVSDTGNDAADTETVEASKPAEETKKDAKPASGDWRDAIVSRLSKQIEQRLKTSVTAAQYDKEYKRRVDAVKANLARYKTPEDYMLAGYAAQERIRSGELAPKALDPKASEKEKAEWRKAMGIPEKPEQYDIPKVPGHDWNESDAPVLNSFKGVAHKANLNQQQVAEVSTWYAQELQKAYKYRDEAYSQLDRQGKIATEEALRADPEIGNAEFRPTINLVNRLLKDREFMPKESADRLLKARGPDGNLVMNDPGMVKMMRQMALARYGDADADMRRGEVVSRVNNRLAEIEQIMKTDINRYHREGLSDEYYRLQDEAAGGGRRR